MDEELERELSSLDWEGAALRGIEDSIGVLAEHVEDSLRTVEWQVRLLDARDVDGDDPEYARLMQLGKT